MLLILSEELRRHLGRALSSHVAWCRTNRVPVPAEVRALMDALAAPGGQDGTGVADVGGRVDSARVDAPPRLFTYGQAADRLNVSERTIRRLVAGGQLACVKVGRARRIPVEAVEAFGLPGPEVA